MQRPTDGRSQFCIPNSLFFYSSPTAAPRPLTSSSWRSSSGGVLRVEYSSGPITSSSPRSHSSPLHPVSPPASVSSANGASPAARCPGNLKPQGITGLPAASGSRWTRAAPSQPPGYEARRPAPLVCCRRENGRPRGARGGRDLGESQVPGPERLPRHPGHRAFRPPSPEAGRTCPPSTPGTLRSRQLSLLAEQRGPRGGTRPKEGMLVTFRQKSDQGAGGPERERPPGPPGPPPAAAPRRSPRPRPRTREEEDDGPAPPGPLGARRRRRRRRVRAGSPGRRRGHRRRPHGHRAGGGGGGPAGGEPVPRRGRALRLLPARGGRRRRPRHSCRSRRQRHRRRRHAARG